MTTLPDSWLSGNDSSDMHSSSYSQSRRKRNASTFYCPMCDESHSNMTIFTHIPQCYYKFVRRMNLSQSPFCLCSVCEGMQSHPACSSCRQQALNNRRMNAIDYNNDNNNNIDNNTLHDRRNNNNINNNNNIDNNTLYDRRNNNNINNNNSPFNSSRSIPNLSPIHHTSSPFIISPAPQPDSAPISSQAFSSTLFNADSNSTQDAPQNLLQFDVNDPLVNVPPVQSSNISQLDFSQLNNLPSRSALMTIHTNPAGRLLQQRESYSLDDFTSKQHIGVHCILCSASTSKVSPNIPLLRIGKYRGYFICKRTHWINDNSKLLSLIGQLRNQPELPGPIKIKKMPKHLESHWENDTINPYTSGGPISCFGHLDHQQIPSICTNSINLTEVPLWIKEEGSIRSFCSASCCLKYLKNIYPGTKKGRKKKTG